MTLATKFEKTWNDGIETSTETENLVEILTKVIGLTGRCVVGLAAEIDHLREELVAKGLLESV